MRALIEQAAAAAGQRNSAALRALISERYADSEGHDKRSLEGILRFYFLRNESVHLLTHIRSVALPARERAQAVVYVGMAGQPVREAGELERLRADLFRFDLEFGLEAGEWRLQRAGWRRAEFADFVAR